MEALHIEATERTPEVILDKDQEVFQIIGESTPEDIYKLYDRVLTWMNHYKAEPNEHTVFFFGYTYFNTASIQMIYEILKVLREIQDSGNKVLVKWGYQEGDDDNYEQAEEFADLIEIDFEFIPVQEVPENKGTVKS